MKKFLAEFKAFALRGNVVDMAVGVVIGGAFAGIVTGLTTNFINPLLTYVMKAGTEAAPWGMMADGETPWTIGLAGSAFLTTIINFIITAFVLFLIIKGVNKMMTIGKKPAAPAAPTTKKCPFCQSEIAIEATRCPHCTSELPAEK